MLNRHRSWARMAAFALALPACGGGTDTVPGTGGATTTSTTTSGSGGATTTGSGGATTTTTSSGTGGTMPMNACKPSNNTVFAVDRLYFGDADWADITDPEAWKLYGLDVDGITSMASASNVCMPSNGATVANVHTDGPNGIDNSFGKLVLPVFLKSIPNLASQANAALVNGDFTILISMAGLGAGPDQPAFPAKVYSGAFLPDIPKFDGTDCWPVAPESLNDPNDIESAKCSYPASTLVANQWDSVGKGDFGLTLQVFSFQGHVTIHQARVLMDMDADHKGTQRGMISGVLDTEEFVAAIDKLLGEFDPATQCSGAFVDNINLKIRQASDIMKDGTQNPGATCDGITIGLGFKAAAVQSGSIGDALTPTPDPCP